MKLCKRHVAIPTSLALIIFVAIHVGPLLLVHLGATAAHARAPAPTWESAVRNAANRKTPDPIFEVDNLKVYGTTVVDHDGTRTTCLIGYAKGNMANTVVIECLK